MTGGFGFFSRPLAYACGSDWSYGCAGRVLRLGTPESLLFVAPRYYKHMDLNRRGFLLWASAPLLARQIRQRIDGFAIGEVYFCRVSDASLLNVARSIYPHCVASHEPRPQFRGITFCGAKATLTVAPDRLS